MQEENNVYAGVYRMGYMESLLPVIEDGHYSLEELIHTAGTARWSVLFIGKDTAMHEQQTD